MAEHRLLPRFRADVEKLVQRKRHSKVLLESGGDVDGVKKSKHVGRAGGDRRQLRGIPVVGSSPGVMPGTSPGANLGRDDGERQEVRRERETS